MRPASLVHLLVCAPLAWALHDPNAPRMPPSPAPAFNTPAWRLGEVCEPPGWGSSNGSMNTSAVAEHVTSRIRFDDVAASDLLRQRRLRIFDVEWPPFASRDTNVHAPSGTGWVGFDIDLLDALSHLLGFEYDIVDMGYPPENITWTEWALSLKNDADLTASFWVQQARRRDHAVMLNGHLDVSMVLVARRAHVETGFTAESLFSWSRPFSAAVWACLVPLVILSGFVDWLLERDAIPDHRVTWSLYEYCSGMLWGGFQHPLSKASAVYQIIVGFIFLMVTASYTANLAAYKISLTAGPALRITSLEQLVADDMQVRVI